LGITSNVKFPNAFGHFIRLGFTLEISGFGELLPQTVAASHLHVNQPKISALSSR